MRILGVDPGLAKTGYGFFNYAKSGSTEILYGTITTLKDTPLPERLLQIYNDLKKVIEETRPEAVVIEELFFCANVKTAIQVAQCRGIIILAAAHSGCAVFEYTPLEIKQAIVGYGHADKLQVQNMVKILLKLDKIPKPDHAADALAAALCHAHSLRFNKAKALASYKNGD